MVLWISQYGPKIFKKEINQTNDSSTDVDDENHYKYRYQTILLKDTCTAPFISLRLCLVCAFCVHVWAQNAFQPFFFFLLSAVKVDFFNCEQCIRTLFMDPQISLFINFFIKNGFHGTIHIFKNYFAIVFFSFQFQFSVFSCIQTDP